MSVEPIDAAAVKAFAIEMSRDPREGLTARQRALMACIVIPSAIQQWMVEAGAVEPLLDSIEKTILAAEAPLRTALQEIADHRIDSEFASREKRAMAQAAISCQQQVSEK